MVSECLSFTVVIPGEISVNWFERSQVDWVEVSSDSIWIKICFTETIQSSLDYFIIDKWKKCASK